MQLVGWLSGILLALCGLPLAYQAWRDGHSRSISNSFLVLWFLGEVFALIYVVSKSDYPLIFNYLWNIIFLVVVIRYKLKER